MDEGVAFEKWEAGSKFVLRGRTITETDMVSYANLMGYTESLFLEMTFLKEKGHEKRMAPNCAVVNTLIVQTRVSCAITRSRFWAWTASSRALRSAWGHPEVEVETIGVRTSRSRHDRDVVSTRQRVRNQRDEVVLEYDVKRMPLRSDG